jgi:hypothetical protein
VLPVLLLFALLNGIPFGLPHAGASEPQPLLRLLPTAATAQPPLALTDPLSRFRCMYPSREKQYLFQSSLHFNFPRHRKKVEAEHTQQPKNQLSEHQNINELAHVAHFLPHRWRASIN